MNRIRKIAFFTSIRSEYGVMVPILKKIQNHPDFELKILVGGAHLLADQGNTKNEIENDGFVIDYMLPFLNNNHNDPIDLVSAMSRLQLQMGECLLNINPDILIIVGDRFELLPVVSASLVLGVPIAHLSGGDITEGSIDNQVRHAVSKISNLHFTGTISSKNNLLKMGEEEWRVTNVGEPAIDYILSLDLLNKNDLFSELGLNITKPVVISTFHPETISKKIDKIFLTDLFKKLVSEFPSHQFLVTASNFDVGGNLINMTFKKLSEEIPQIKFIHSLGQLRYYSLLKYADFMLGNSSSGIIEAQSFHLPVINVGTRQDGRERNVNTIDVGIDTEAIIRAARNIKDFKFQETMKKSQNLYGNGKCADSVIKCLESVKLESLLLKKSVF